MKVNWKEEKETLEKLINDNVPYVQIGKQYGVTCNAVIKAAKKLGIHLPQKREINPLETFGKHSNDVIEVCKNCGKEFAHPKHLGVKTFCCQECKNDYYDKKGIDVVEPNIKGWYTHKNIGELGEQIAIGELGKYGIQVIMPLSDNLPFDIVIFLNNKFYKCQIKTTGQIKNGAALYRMVTATNTKNPHSYTKDEVDVFILCDLEHIFLLTFDEFHEKGETTFTLRYSTPTSGQIKNIRFAADYIISNERIEKVFN